MKIVIYDTNIKFSKKLSDYLEKLLFKNILIYDYSITTFSSIEELDTHISNHQVDLLFFDIPGSTPDAYALTEKLVNQQHKYQLVFMSQYNEAVYYCFCYHPYRFIRKQFYKQELSELLTSFIKENYATSNTLTIKNYSNIFNLPIPDIYYIEKKKCSNYIVIHTNSDCYKQYSSLLNMKNMLPAFFLYAGQHLLINASHILSIDSALVTLDNGTQLKVAIHDKKLHPQQHPTSQLAHLKQKQQEQQDE